MDFAAIRELIAGNQDIIEKTAQEYKKIKTKLGDCISESHKELLMDQIKELAAVKIELGHDEQSYASSQQEEVFSSIEDQEEGPGDEEEDESHSEYSGSESDEDDATISRAKRRATRARTTRKAPNKQALVIQNFLDSNVNVFEKARSKFKKPSAAVCSRDAMVKNLKQLLQQSDSLEDDDLEIETGGEETIPIDPFTNKEVVNPVKNTKCGHIYDKDGILAFISSRPNPRCPTIGCNNRNVLKEDLEEDSALKARIDRLRAMRDNESDEEDDLDDEEMR